MALSTGIRPFGVRSLINNDRESSALPAGRLVISFNLRREGDEIMPDREVKFGDIWVQYFYTAKHRNYKKLFLDCVYNDRRSITKEITSEYKVCVSKYSDKNSEILYFSCASIRTFFHHFFEPKRIKSTT